MRIAISILTYRKRSKVLEYLNDIDQSAKTTKIVSYLQKRCNVIII